MLLAAVALVFPGVARFAQPAGAAAILVVWLLPLLAAMAHDAWIMRPVHRLYWMGLGVMVVAFSRVALMEAEPWLAIGRRIIAAVLPAGFGPEADRRASREPTAGSCGDAPQARGEGATKEEWTYRMRR
jgi:hypothetical protein